MHRVKTMITMIGLIFLFGVKAQYIANPDQARILVAQSAASDVIVIGDLMPYSDYLFINLDVYQASTQAKLFSIPIEDYVNELYIRGEEIYVIDGLGLFKVNLSTGDKVYLSNLSSFTNAFGSQSFMSENGTFFAAKTALYNTQSNEIIEFPNHCIFALGDDGALFVDDGYPISEVSYYNINSGNRYTYAISELNLNISETEIQQLNPCHSEEILFGLSPNGQFFSMGYSVYQANGEKLFSIEEPVGTLGSIYNTLDFLTPSNHGELIAADESIINVYSSNGSTHTVLDGNTIGYMVEPAKTGNGLVYYTSDDSFADNWYYFDISTKTSQLLKTVTYDSSCSWYYIDLSANRSQFLLTKEMCPESDDAFYPELISLSDENEATALSKDFSGAWFNRERSGEGFLIEMLKNNRFNAYWFTYDKSGNPLYIFGAGDYRAGATEITIDTYTTSGPLFGAAYNKDDLVRHDWGTITFSFAGCNRSTIHYNSPDYGSGSIDMTRLSAINTTDCYGANDGSDQRASGAWFNRTRNGEGFLVEALAANRYNIYWFTYDNAGKPLYIYGVGYKDTNGLVDVSEARTTNGPVFGNEYDKNDLNAPVWGNFQFQMQDCSNATVTYDGSASGYDNGETNLTRLSVIEGSGC